MIACDVVQESVLPILLVRACLRFWTVATQGTFIEGVRWLALIELENDGKMLNAVWMGFSHVVLEVELAVKPVVYVSYQKLQSAHPGTCI